MSDATSEIAPRPPGSRAAALIGSLALAVAVLGGVAEGAVGGLGASPKVRVRASPIYLWCGDPAGAACELASEAMGVMPVQASQLPAELLDGFDDEPNDCARPEVADLVARISRALDLDPTGWADQVGTTVPVDLVSERYQGGGCITMANRLLPTVKIHARSSPGPRTFLVRVWEAEGP